MRLDLPYDKNGRGVPTAGKIPDIIPTLMKTCMKNNIATPIQINLPNWCLQWMAV